MKILIDECVPAGLAPVLRERGYECDTVRQAGYGSKKNGELLRLDKRRLSTASGRFGNNALSFTQAGSERVGCYCLNLISVFVQFERAEINYMPPRLSVRAIQSLAISWAAFCARLNAGSKSCPIAPSRIR
jgi:hypothetical protein